MAPDRPRLRQARHEAGLTQQGLADRLGVPQPVIAVYETGRREPHVRAAIRLAMALGSTVEAIWPPDHPRSPRAASTAGGVTTHGGTMSSKQHPNEPDPMERLPGYVKKIENDPDPIEVRGLHGEVLTIGSAESADQDGLLLCLGSEELFLDARGADDLVHALLEARSR